MTWSCCRCNEPSFDRANALRIIAWVAQNEDPEATPRTTFRWDGDDLVMTESFDQGEQYDQRVEPDPHGRYWIGANSWTWDEIQVPNGETLDAWLQRTNEDAHVHAEANNIANTWAIEAGIGWPERRIPTAIIARNAVTQLARLRPADPRRPLSDEAMTYLHLGDSGGAHPSWADLSSEQRAALMDLAVRRATHPELLRRAFTPKSAT